MLSRIALKYVSSNVHLYWNPIFDSVKELKYRLEQN